MSHPKRYDCADSNGMDECMAYMDECENGEYVTYSDYAALAAELERMRSEHEVGFSSVVLKKWSAEHAALAAENERLRKAAQAVYDELHKWGDNSPMVIQNLMDAINAAKEGSDAK